MSQGLLVPGEVTYLVFQWPKAVESQDCRGRLAGNSYCSCGRCSVFLSHIIPILAVYPLPPYVLGVQLDLLESILIAYLCVLLA